CSQRNTQNNTHKNTSTCKSPTASTTTKLTELPPGKLTYRTTTTEIQTPSARRHGSSRNNVNTWSGTRTLSTEKTRLLVHTAEQTRNVTDRSPYLPRQNMHITTKSTYKNGCMHTTVGEKK
ncbi:unnamed protein product, partial [Ectocarpus sp. 12 AP-2014]